MFECAGETEHSRHGGEKLGLSLLQPIRQGVHVLLTGVVGEADAQYAVLLLFGELQGGIDVTGPAPVAGGAGGEIDALVTEDTFAPSF